MNSFKTPLASYLVKAPFIKVMMLLGFLVIFLVFSNYLYFDGIHFTAITAKVFKHTGFLTHADAVMVTLKYFLFFHSLMRLCPL